MVQYGVMIKIMTIAMMKFSEKSLQYRTSLFGYSKVERLLSEYSVCLDIADLLLELS